MICQKHLTKGQIMLSDSLELLHFLECYAERQGQNATLIEPAVEQLNIFTNKWRDGHYRLFPRESCDEQALKNALVSALGHDVAYIEFVSVREVKKQGIKQERRFFRIAHEGSLARELRRSAKHQEIFSTSRGLKSEERSLRDLVALSLGTRSLQPALDKTFGNSVGRIAKNDFIELWYLRFCYILVGQFTKAEELDGIIELCRKNPPLGRLQKEPHTWLFWED